MHKYSVKGNFVQEDQYRPYAENPQISVEICEPQGKDVVHLAAYGGYALWFFLTGAKSVSSVDLSRESFRVNKLQQTMISSFDYKDNLSLMKNLASNSLLEDLSQKADMEINYLKNYFEQVSLYSRNSTDNFPQLQGEDIFEKIKSSIQLGKWEIFQEDLLDFLQKRKEDSVDIIYVSTLRNWIFQHYLNLNKSFQKNIQLFLEEVDNPLAESSYKCLRNDGKFVDLLPDKITSLPRFRIDTNSRRGPWGIFNDFPQSYYLDYTILKKLSKN
jgi:S-adenosylmethionine:diacylglycerol 3-amino-3-carboxypropyl transferase